MSYPALQIANAFIKKANFEGKEISNLKLQKLIFIANGIYLVTSDKQKPLILEKISVWPYGPVVASVYHSFKNYGNSKITSLSIEEQLNMWKHTLSDEAEQSIEMAWSIGKDVDPIKLSNWTHDENSPWSKAKMESNDEIPDDYIVDYFKQFVNN